MSLIAKYGRLGVFLSWLIVLTLAVATLGVSQSAVGAWLQDQTTVMLFHLRGPRLSSNRYSVLELGKHNDPTLPISLESIAASYATAVEKLADTGAAGIVIVTMLPAVDAAEQPNTSLSPREIEQVHNSYRLLASAIAEARADNGCPVVLAARRRGEGIVLPAAELVEAAGGLETAIGIDSLGEAGVSNTAIRWLDPPSGSDDTAALLPLPFLADLLASGGNSPTVPIKHPHRMLTQRLAANFVGPTGSIHHVDYDKLLSVREQDADQPAVDWAGQVVLLGWHGWPDGPLSTPYMTALVPPEMFRAEVLANMADTLTADCGLTELPLACLAGLVFLCLIFSTLEIMRLPSGFSLIMDVLLVGVLAAVTYGLFLQHYLLPTGVLIIGLVLNSLVIRALLTTIALRASLGMQKQTHVALHQRESLLRAVLDTNPACMHVRDATGKVLLANLRFAMLFAEKPEHVVGQTLKALCASVGRQPIDPQTWLSGDEDVAKRLRVITSLERTESPRGTRWHQTRKLPLLTEDGDSDVLVISEDVTRLLRTEEELRHEHSLLEGVFTSVPEMIFAVDCGLRLLNANPAYLDEIGVDPTTTEIKGIKEQLFHDDQRCREEIASCPACRVIASGQAFREDRKHKTEKRAERQLEITATPLFGSEGQLRGVVQVVRDVTRQRNMERQLRVSQKLEAIGTLAGGVAHDFNNILTGIFGFTEMAMHDSPQDSEQHEYLSEVLHASQRASNLVKQILVFSRKSDITPQVIRLQPLVNEVLSLLRASLPSTITLKKSIDQKAGSVMADITQMHQMILNLCTNAAQAMLGSDETLTVSLQEVDVYPELASQFLGLNEGKHICLTVSDTGHGIPEDIRDRIFEPFFTTKDPGSGTGMGLAIVHGILTKCGGVIGVESEMGIGSKFSVYLPCVEQTDTEPIDGQYQVPRGSARVMVVEDEPALAELMAKRLVAWGFDVEQFTSSPAALEMFLAQPDDFDLVITDQTMPNLTGAELAAEVLRIRPDLPVVLCTGFSDTVPSELAYRLGISEYMMKPITEKALAEALSRVLDDKQQASEP